MTRPMLSCRSASCALVVTSVLVAAACGDGSAPVAPAAPASTQAAMARRSSGARIYFTSDRDTPGFYDIYSMNADGSDVTRLTYAPGQDKAGPVSPDGTRILFTSDRDDPMTDIYVMNVDGSGVTRLTYGGGKDGSPSWSKDGKRIAFQSTRSALDPTSGYDKDEDIYVMNANGSQVTRLTSQDGFDGDPAWSPDGKRIAFVSNRSNQLEAFMMDADGSNVQQVTSYGAFITGMAWSPDGRRIALTMIRSGFAPSIFVMNDDGTQLGQISPTNSSNILPQWTDTGDQLVFTSSRDGNDEVYLMNADGTGATRITNNPASDGIPFWHR